MPTTVTSTGKVTIPNQDIALEKVPGHWLLARMGKRVLRPGGIELTRRLLASLKITGNDDVVEFAPGLGVTARITLAQNPKSYTAVERDRDAAERVRSYLSGENRQCVLGSAEQTGLPEGCASVVYAEAMLSMQPNTTKQRIVNEAARLLRSSGRYGIHELCLTPNNVSQAMRDGLQQEMSAAIHVGVRPLTRDEWGEILDHAGLRVVAEHTSPMHLLEPRRLIQDEGFFRALRFALNVARTPAARERVRAMRSVFRKYSENLTAIALVAEKK